MDSLTDDHFFNGEICIRQNKSGYRFSVDSILLASYVKATACNKVLDIGTGCGIISIILAYRNPKIKIYGIEVQKNLADIAALNVKNNGMEEQVKIICTDIKNLKKDMLKGPPDIIVCNPPYRKAKSGRVNPDNQRALARHEIMISLPEIFESAKRLMDISGKIIMIYPSERIADIIAHMRFSGIEPKYFRFIYSKKRAESKLLIAEGIKGGKAGAKILPPLVIYKDDGSYSNEVENMFKP